MDAAHAAGTLTLYPENGPSPPTLFTLHWGRDASISEEQHIMHYTRTADLGNYSLQLPMQGEALPAISRFQAAAVGDAIYIHTHRSIDDIFCLECTDLAAPRLSKISVSGSEGTPMSRCRFQELVLSLHFAALS